LLLYCYLVHGGSLVVESAMSNDPTNTTASLLCPTLALCLHVALFAIVSRATATQAPQVMPPVAIAISLVDAPMVTAPAPVAEVVTPPVPKPVSPPIPRPVRQPAPTPVADDAPTPEPEAPSDTSTDTSTPTDAPTASEPQVVATSGGANVGATPSPGVAAGVSSPVFDAAYLNNPHPPYPPMSTRMREEGKVILRVRVLPNGRAEQVEIKHSSGSARLDESARATVLRHWRFVPARQGDAAVAAWVLVPISFRLKENS
jgi:protein TonB